MTLTCWSREHEQPKPNLSVFQSTLTIGCYARTFSFRSSTLPATPTGRSFSSLIERFDGQWYLQRFKAPLPPSDVNKSLFYGKCLTPQIVELWANSVKPTQPCSGWYVFMSKVWNFDSRVVTVNLFMLMSGLSNSNPQTPFLTFVSQRKQFVRRSKSFTSPLSQPAARHRSSQLYAFPKATVQQSGLIASFSDGSRLTTGASCLGSHTRTQPSAPPVTSSGAPKSEPLPPMPSI